MIETVEISPEMQNRREITRLTNRVNALEEYAASLEHRIQILEMKTDVRRLR